MVTFQYWTLDPPSLWKAGTTTPRGSTTPEPFYFGCADCGQKDARIAGIISTDGTFAGIGTLPLDPPDGFFRKPAMFCGPCFDARRSHAS